MFNSTNQTNSTQGVRLVNTLVKSSLFLNKKFNQFLLISFSIFLNYSVSATNYYVSTSGNDSNSGTSESAPWKTLAKVNSFTPKPGDQILFKRGDEWTGSITVNASGTSSSQIIYGAYGTGNKPRIYGSEKITGWTLHSGNIYKATFNTAVNQLFLNDSRMKAARYPNTGWFLTTTVSSATQFTCTSLSGNINYSGAKLIIKTNEWRLDTRDVTGSTAQTINFNQNLVYTLEKERPFFLTNKLEFLDQAGEWYYDNNTKTVYFWTPNNDTPNNYNIRVSAYENGIMITGKSYVSICNLDLQQHSKTGIDAYNSNSNIKIDNNEIYNTEIYGIKSQGAANIISNNKVDGINSIGIIAWNSANGQVIDNTILNTGIFENIGVNGMVAGYTTAIPLSGNGQIVKNNRIVACGYIGINFSGFNTTVENNYIENTCSILFDGGAIYSWSSDINIPSVTGSVIKNNIVLSNNGTAAIFMDDKTQNVLIEGNTVAHTTGSRYHSIQTVAYGIFLINNKNVEVRNNTLFNNARSWSLKETYEGNKFINNTVCNIKTTPPSGYLEPLLTHKNTTQNNCSYDNNTYIDRHRTKAFRFDDTGVNVIFNDWKAGIKGDVNSTFIGTGLATGETEELFYNDTKLTKTINLGSYLYKDIYGKQVPQSLTLEPFTSKILIKTSYTSIPDKTLPTIISLDIPSTSASLTVNINSFTASDNIAVSGFMITESSLTPYSYDENWQSSAPTSLNFTSEGTKMLFAWVKDAAGNISECTSRKVVISLSDGNTLILGNTEVSNLVSTTANRRAVPVTFNENGIIESISIYHNGGTGNLLMGVYSDQSGTPYSLLGSTASTLINSTEGWQTISLLSPVKVSSGQKIWLSWVFQNNPGIRYYIGTPSRAQSTGLWSAGMPTQFGASSFADYNYSIFCSYSNMIEEPNILDVTKPVISAFTIPATSSSLEISINSFTATDNKSVAGFLITENSATPVADISGWKTSAPTSYSFSSEGTKTLYVWVKDAAGNISASKSAQVVITLPDVTKPVISAFSIPATSASLEISINSFNATDNKSVTGFLIAENSTTPTTDISGWKTSAPTSYSFTSEGTKTLYAWVKDAAGNVSASKSAQVVITLSDVTKPIILSFSIPDTTKSFIIPITSFEAVDDKEVTGYMLTETESCPLVGNSCWTTIAPTTYTIFGQDVPVDQSSSMIINEIGLKSGSQISISNAIEVTKTIYAWTKDAAGNISNAEKDEILILFPDVESPSITLFTIPAKSTSLTVDVINLSATDNTAVTGILLTESPSVPDLENKDWNTGVPTSYTFTSEGTKTLYAWTKDAAGNISSNASAIVVISLPDIEKPIISTFNIPANSSSLTINIGSLIASDNVGITGYMLTESFSTPVSGNAGWKTSAPTSFVFTTEGTKTLYAWVKDAAGNVSASKSAKVIISLLPNTANIQGITDVFSSVTTTQNRRAVPIIFTENAKIESISIYHNGGSGNMLLGVYSDQSGSPLLLLGVTQSTKINTSEGWQTISLINPVLVKSGQKVWLSWVFQTNPGIRYSVGTPARAQSDNLWLAGMPGDFGKSSFGDYIYSIYCSYSIDTISTAQPDVTKPVVTAFTVPATSESLAIPVSSFTGSDNSAVSGFKITETSVTPNVNDAGWSTSAPTNYVFTTEGTKMLFAWVKDAAGNVSTSKSAQVVIALPVEVEIPETNVPDEQLNTQSIGLKKGWNIFSTYLEPKNESIDSVMIMLQEENNLNIVQDKYSKTYEKCPETQNWINNIGNLQKSEGYMIKVESDCFLELSGKQIQLPFNIEIRRGWNIISFPIDGFVDAMKVVQPLIDAGVLYKVQDERGYSIENWRGLGWKNGIGNFNAGEGYILQANKNGILTINDLSSKSSSYFVERSETSHFKLCYEGNGINHMNINLVELNEANFQVGDEIAAFDGERCVGAIKLTEFDLVNNTAGMAVSASEQNEITGFTEGNPIKLKVWKNENGQETIFQPEVIEGELTFNKQASVFVTLNSQSTIAADKFDNLKIDMYPNPASNIVTIRFSSLPAEGTKIKLLDVLGNEIRTQVVKNTHETFNIQDLPVGMYVLKTESNNNQRIQKLIKR